MMRIMVTYQLNSTTTFQQERSESETPEGIGFARQKENHLQALFIFFFFEKAGL